MSSEPPVLYTVANNIAHVVMNRPGAMNAMSVGMITELRQALERAQSDPDVSIIVLTGAGNNFCAGDDLKEAAGGGLPGGGQGFCPATYGQDFRRRTLVSLNRLRLASPSVTLVI